MAGLLGLLGLLLGPAFGSVVDASAQTAEGDTPIRVSAFGDSVLLGARDQLISQLAPWPVTVDAQEDRSLLGAITLLQAAQPTLGNVVVLDLGYNDSSDTGAFRQRIDGAMAPLAGVSKVIWLNQSEWTDGRAGMNAELVAAQSRYPNLDVVDWNAVVVAHPEDVYTDHIHLTPAGQVAMAMLVRQHIDAYVASQRTPATTAPPPSTTKVPPATSPASPAKSRNQDNSGTHTVTRRRLALAAVAVVVIGVAVWYWFRRRRRRRRRGKRGSRQ